MTKIENIENFILHNKYLFYYRDILYYCITNKNLTYTYHYTPYNSNIVKFKNYCRKKEIKNANGLTQNVIIKLRKCKYRLHVNQVLKNILKDECGNKINILLNGTVCGKNKIYYYHDGQLIDGIIHFIITYIPIYNDFEYVLNLIKNLCILNDIILC